MSENNNISSLFDRSGNLTPQAMERYLRNELSPEDLSFVEAHLAESPFDREALEGLGKNGDLDFIKYVTQLNEKIRHISEKKKTISAPHRLSRYYWAAAASLLTLVSLTVILLFVFRESPRITQMSVVQQDTVQEKRAGMHEAVDQPAASKAKESSPSESFSQPVQEDKTVASPVSEEQEKNSEERVEEVPQVVEPEVTIVESEPEMAAGQPANVDNIGGVSVKGNAGRIAQEQNAKTKASYTIQADHVKGMEEKKTAGEEIENYMHADQMPQFPGGDSALNVFLKENLKYPEPAKTSGIKGTVYLTFMVNTDGTVSDIEVLKGIGGGCDEEAIRVVSLMPDWLPGKQNGKPVPVQHTLAVLFDTEER